MASAREQIEILIDGIQDLQAEGYEPGNVFSADTQDNPKTFPFCVVRWDDQQPGMGDILRRPFQLWWYDESGDYRRIDRIGKIVREYFLDLLPQPIDSGLIMKVEGGLLGGDLADDTWNAVVKQQSFTAVGRGV